MRALDRSPRQRLLPLLICLVTLTACRNDEPPTVAAPESPAFTKESTVLPIPQQPGALARFGS